MWILRVDYLDGLLPEWTIRTYTEEYETKSSAMRHGTAINREGLWIADGHDRRILILPRLVRNISIFRSVR